MCATCCGENSLRHASTALLVCYHRHLIEAFSHTAHRDRWVMLVGTSSRSSNHSNTAPISLKCGKVQSCSTHLFLLIRKTQYRTKLGICDGAISLQGFGCTFFMVLVLLKVVAHAFTWARSCSCHGGGEAKTMREYAFPSTDLSCPMRGFRAPDLAVSEVLVELVCPCIETAISVATSWTRASER